MAGTNYEVRMAWREAAPKRTLQQEVSKIYKGENNVDTRYPARPSSTTALFFVLLEWRLQTSDTLLGVFLSFNGAIMPLFRLAAFVILAGHFLLDSRTDAIGGLKFFC